MTINVGLKHLVLVTLYHGLQLDLNETITFGDTKYHVRIHCSRGQRTHPMPFAYMIYVVNKLGYSMWFISIPTIYE